MWVWKCSIEAVDSSVELKVLSCLESSFLTWILRNMNCHTNTELADMHFMYGAAQKNGLHPMHIQQLWHLLKDNTLLWYCSFNRRNSAISYKAHIMPGSMKWSTHAQLPVQASKCSMIWQIPTWESFSYVFFEKRLHFLAQPHTWIACQQAPHLCKDACCLKSVWRMMIQASEALSSFKLNSILYCLNTVFLHAHFYTKSAYLGLLYLPLHFLHTVLKHPVL